jgi:hypothetical protein
MSVWPVPGTSRHAAELTRTIVEMEGRLRQLESELEVKSPEDGRAHQFSYVTLGLAVADDAARRVPRPANPLPVD